MASSRGKAGILKFARLVCKFWRTYGARYRASLSEEVSPAFVAALDALDAAVATFEGLDDYPYEIDRNDSSGPA